MTFLVLSSNPNKQKDTVYDVPQIVSILMKNPGGGVPGALRTWWLFLLDPPNLYKTPL